MKWIDVRDYAAMSALAAERIFEVITAKAQAGKPVNIGLATGNTMIRTYAVLAALLNQSGTNLSGLTTFNLDEYVGADGRNVEESHPLSYRAYMREKLIDKLNPALGLRPDKIMFPDAVNAAGYDRAIAAAGGIDFQLLGLGFNGHIAFNEPMTELAITANEFCGLPSRVVNLEKRTLETNASLTAGNDLALVPTKAATMGMSSILRAREIMLLACFAEQAAPLRRIQTGRITPEIPASCLWKHPASTIVYTSDKIKI
ncbi:MAG: glucosamine-6-phosphate deaminase [Kiritimatiellae bacterium]|nr:glucosamine-6-phosphate deaminase [Kiritimatiellia bacterium]